MLRIFPASIKEDLPYQALRLEHKQRCNWTTEFHPQYLNPPEEASDETGHQGPAPQRIIISKKSFQVINCFTSLFM
jgi:hypothetical protein